MNRGGFIPSIIAFKMFHVNKIHSMRSSPCSLHVLRTKILAQSSAGEKCCDSFLNQKFPSGTSSESAINQADEKRFCIKFVPDIFEG